MGRLEAVAGESTVVRSPEMRNRGRVWRRGMARGADASKGMGWGQGRPGKSVVSQTGGAAAGGRENPTAAAQQSSSGAGGRRS